MKILNKMCYFLIIVLVISCCVLYYENNKLVQKIEDKKIIYNDDKFNYLSNIQKNKVYCNDVIKYFNKNKQTKLIQVSTRDNKINAKVEYLDDLTSLKPFLCEFVKTKGFSKINDIYISSNNEGDLIKLDVEFNDKRDG